MNHLPERDPRAVALSQSTALDYHSAKDVVDRYGDDAEAVAVALTMAGVHPTTRDRHVLALLRAAGVMP